MAKLPEALQRQAEASESSNFEPLPAGVYRARLTELNVTTAKSTGNPMWVTIFEVVDGDHQGRKIWNNLVLMDKTAWKIKEFFDAFGASLDEDTEEFLGQIVKLNVVLRVIGGGAKEGQLGNNVDKMMPDDAPKAAAKAEPKKLASVGASSRRHASDDANEDELAF